MPLRGGKICKGEERKRGKCKIKRKKGERKKLEIKG
jgi:hypothetical protein